MANLPPTTQSSSPSSPLPTRTRVPSEVLEFHKECPWYDSVCWKIPPKKTTSTTDLENNNNSHLTMPSSGSSSTSSSWSQEADATTYTPILSHNETAAIELATDVSIFTTDRCFRVVIFAPSNGTRSTSSSLDIDNLDGIYTSSALMNADRSTTVIKNNGREIFDTTETSTSVPSPSPSPSQPSTERYFEVGGRKYAYNYVDSGECICQLSKGSKALAGIFGAIGGLVFIAALIAIVVKVKRALGEKEASDSAILSRWATRRDARKAAAQRKKDQLHAVNGAQSVVLENADQAGLTTNSVPTAATTQQSQYRYSSEADEENDVNRGTEETDIDSVRISIRAEDHQPPANAFILPFEDSVVVEREIKRNESEKPRISQTLTEQQPLTLFTCTSTQEPVVVRDRQSCTPPMVPSDTRYYLSEYEDKSGGFNAKNVRGESQQQQQQQQCYGEEQHDENPVAAYLSMCDPRSVPTASEECVTNTTFSPLPPHFNTDPTASPNSSIYSSASTGQADDRISRARVMMVDSSMTNTQRHTLRGGEERRPPLLPLPLSAPQRRHRSRARASSAAATTLLPHNRHLSVSPLTEEQRRLASYIRQIRRSDYSSNTKDHSSSLNDGLSPSLGSITRNRSRSAPRV